MALTLKTPKNPYEFPGVEGKTQKITTNMFHLIISKSNIIKKINVVAVTKDKEGKKVTVESNKVFSIFKKAYSGLFKQLEIKHIVEGYPSEHGITVYIITKTAPFFKEREIGGNKIIAQFCGNISINDWNTFDNDLKMFLKKAFTTTIYEMFDKHQYTLMKRVIYSFKTEGNFPAVFLNNFQSLPGIRLGYETDIPDKKDSSRSKNLVSINYTQTVATRASVSLLKCYEGMCTEVIASLSDTRGIQVHAKSDQKIPPECVDLMNEVFQNLQVYIPYESNEKNHFYYKIVEILPKSATSYFLQKNGKKVPIIADCEKLYKIKIQYPGMNAVLIKCKKGKEYRVPLEIVVLSDKPQRVHASASYISTHLSERLKELAALVPGKRWEYICDAAGKFHAALMDTPGKSNLLKEIGLELNDIPITVNARVLDPPVDTYSKDDETLAIPYQNPVEYVLVDFSKNNNDENDNVEENVNHLMERMREKFGISITNTQVFFKFKYNANANCGDENVLKDLETVVQWHTENKPKKAGRKLIYIVVIENAHKSTNLHALIKKKFEKNGMTSQVVTVAILHNTRATYRPTDMVSQDYTYNIALNINAKLGGVNCVPSKDEKNSLWHEYINDKNPTMFIGIDTRLSSKEKNKQSVVAILTSIDTIGARYDQSFQMVKEGRYTSDFTTAINNAIDCFKDSNGKHVVPKNFIIFRAGMNELELTAKTGEGFCEFKNITVIINNYMKRNRINIVPKLTYIGYNRSHNARFYDSNNEDLIKKEEDGVKLNCAVGTVIDSTVTNKNCFYLISHETFLGTTKPPKYRVVNGMGNYKVDNLLAIVYQLCRLNPQTKQSFHRPVPIGLASKLLNRIVEKCPEIFDGKVEDIQNILCHEDFKGISYYI